MHPHLFHISAFILVALAGGVFGIAFFANSKKITHQIYAAIGGALAAGIFAHSREWGHNAIPVQSYGTMILIGFLVAVSMAAHRAPLLGVEARHGIDIGAYGVIVGLIGARVFDVVMNWRIYSPFQDGSLFQDGLFHWECVWDMFKLWKGGLVFYGTLLVILPYSYLYCRMYKIKPLPFMDLTIISLIVGLAFGRIGCFLRGCCFGKRCAANWAVAFPARAVEDSAAHFWHVQAGWIPREAPCSLPVYPTQLFASLAAGLAAAFLWFYWPRRKYDGQILSLALIMVGATRFFEEALRDDEGAVFPSVCSWMTIAQWMAIVLVIAGFAAMFYFRGRSHGKRIEARVA